MKRTSLLISLLMVLLLVSGCTDMLPGLPSLNGALTGTVVDDVTSKGISGAIVEIENSSKTQITNSTGTFSFNNLAAGSYNLKITKDGYEAFTATYQVHVGDTNTVNIHLIPVTEGSKGTIKGRVVYQGTTEPIDGVTVKVDDTDISVQTNLYGEFSLRDLEYGTYILVFNKDGFGKHIQEIRLNQETADVIVELKEVENLAKNMVGNFKKSMYQLGTVYFQEQSVIKDNVMDDVMPFFEALSPNFEEMGRGLYHIEVIDETQAPGEYECIWYKDEYGEEMYPTYILVEPGDPLADEWVWKVHDNGSLITITFPNMDQRVVEYEDYNQVDIDFTGSTLEYSILSATQAEYKVLLNVGSADTKNFSLTHTEYDEYNGTIETYVINAVVPSGPTAELDVIFDTNYNDEYQEIRVNGSMNLDTFIEDMVFSLGGSVETPVIKFYGELETQIFGAGGVTEIAELEGHPFNVWAFGEIMTDDFVIDGEIHLEVDFVEAIDDIGVYLRPVPYHANMDVSYASYETTFTGLIDFDFLNFETYFTSTDMNKFEDMQIHMAGDLTHGDQIEYCVDLFFTRPENAEVQVNMNLWTGEFGLSGELAYDEEEGFAYINLFDNNDTHFEAEVPSHVTGGEEVGKILGANGETYATVAFSEELGASFFIQYTDGEWEMLPLDPVAYLPNDTIE